MKKNIKLTAILLSTAILMVGCGKAADTKSTADTSKDTKTETTTEATADTTTDTTAKDVDYSEYVTLGEYKGVQYTKPEAIEVTDEEVNTQIQSTLESNKVKTPITDRDTVAEGDVANIDYEGLLDGKAFEGGTAQGQDLTIGADQFIDGFEDQLIGKKVGETATVNVTFPADYSATDLAGKAVVFNVKINSINTETTPELTDEYVAGISESKTVDEYKQSVRDDITKTKEQDAESKKQSEIWTAVKANCQIKEYPQTLVDDYTKKITDSYGNYAQQAGVTIDEFMTSYFGMSVADYAKQVAADEMVFDAIVKDAKLSVTDDVFKTKAAEMATTYGYESADALIKTAGEDQLKQSILWDLMMDYLTENAKEA
jgi:trigger factor